MQANDLYKEKDYKSAIELYQKSAEAKIFEAPSFYNSAVCFIKMKDYKAAIPLIYKALALKRESKYYFNLAYCYIMINQNDKALNYFNIAWSKDNSDEECKKAIDLLLNRIKK